MHASAPKCMWWPPSLTATIQSPAALAVVAARSRSGRRLSSWFALPAHSAVVAARLAAIQPHAMPHAVLQSCASRMGGAAHAMPHTTLQSRAQSGIVSPSWLVTRTLASTCRAYCSLACRRPHSLPPVPRTAIKVSASVRA